MLGEALLEHETIHGEDLPRLFAGKPLERVGSNGKAGGKGKKSKPKKKAVAKAPRKSSKISASAKPKK